MQLMTRIDVPIDDRQQVFRASPAVAFVAVTAVLIAIAGLGAIVWHGRSWLAAYVAMVLLLGLLLTRRLALARLRPSNWLVRMNDDGAFVQFRSYLNYHFPVEDPTVVFVPFGEIRSARGVHLSREIPDETRAGSQTLVRWLVELDLAADTGPLAQALSTERTKTVPRAATWRHYPVRLVSPTRLQMDWEVVPGARVFLALLGRFTEVGAPVRVSQDDLHLDGAGRKEAERRLRELASEGQIMAAIKIARRLHSLTLAEARSYVDSLPGDAPGGEVVTGSDREPVA